MAVEVAAGPAGAVDEVHVHRDAAAQGARFGEPRIDHRDADAPPGVAPDLFEAGPHLLRACGFRRHGHRGIDRPIGGQSADRRIGRERRHRGLVHADDGPQSQPALDLEPVPLNQRLHRVGRARQNQPAPLPPRYPFGDIGGDARAEPARASAIATPTIAHSSPHGHHQRDARGGASFLPRKWKGGAVSPGGMRRTPSETVPVFRSKERSGALGLWPSLGAGAMPDGRIFAGHGSGCADAETLVRLNPNPTRQLKWASCFLLDRPMTNSRVLLEGRNLAGATRGCRPSADRPSGTAVIAARKRLITTRRPQARSPADVHENRPAPLRIAPYASVMSPALRPPRRAHARRWSGLSPLRRAGTTAPPCQRVRSSPPSAPSRVFNRFAASDRSTGLWPLLHARLVQLNHRPRTSSRRWPPSRHRPGRPHLHPHAPQGVVSRTGPRSRPTTSSSPSRLSTTRRRRARSPAPQSERTAPRRQEGRRSHGGADAAGARLGLASPAERPAHPARAQAARRPRQGQFAKAWSTATPPAEITGLGPYRLRSYTPGERIELARNPR